MKRYNFKINPMLLLKYEHEDVVRVEEDKNGDYVEFSDVLELIDMWAMDTGRNTNDMINEVFGDVQSN